MPNGLVKPSEDAISQNTSPANLGNTQKGDEAEGRVESANAQDTRGGAIDEDEAEDDGSDEQDAEDEVEDPNTTSDVAGKREDGSDANPDVTKANVVAENAVRGPTGEGVRRIRIVNNRVSIHLV